VGVKPPGLLGRSEIATLGRLLAQLDADAALDLIFGKMTGDVRGREERHRGPVDESAEIGIAIFRQQRPIVGDGVVYSGAGSPAITRMRNAGEAAAKIRGVISVFNGGEGGAAGGVEQMPTRPRIEP
jgi:hypothetical protein